MKIKIIILIILIIGLFNPLLHSQDNYKFIKNIEIKKDDVFKGNIVSVDGKLLINGKVTESIIILDGSIEVNGEVDGDIICIASDVSIKDNAKISGDLVVLGDKPVINKGRVKGKYNLIELDLKKIKNTIIPILTGSEGYFILKLIKTSLWFILILLVFAFTSKKVYKAEVLFANNKKKIIFVSFAAFGSFIFLLLFFAFLSLLLIGLPFLLLLLVFYFIVLTFGRTVFLYYLGKRISLLLKLKNLPPILFLFFGLLFYIVLLFLPFAGKIILLILNILEFGIGFSCFFKKRLQFLK